MENLKNNGNLIRVILLIIGMILVFVLAIRMFMSIWGIGESADAPNVENSAQEMQEVSQPTTTVNKYVGKYTEINWNVGKQVNFYARWICDALNGKNIARINELVSKEYMKYYNYDSDKLIAHLTKKGLWGKKLTIDKYEYSSFGEDKVFKLHIFSNDNSVDDYVTLVEYTPKKVEIAFDDFYTAKSEAKEYIRENLKFTFSNQVFFDTKYKVDMKIKNTSNNDVILNKMKDYENIYVNINGIGSKKVISTVFAGQAVTLKPNAEFNAVLEFDLQSLAFTKIYGVTLKDITFTGNNVTKDIVINF